MRKLLLLVLFLCVLSVAAAQDLEPYSAQSITIDGTITNSLTITRSGGDPAIRSLNANISWFPRERPGQQVLFLDTVPKASITDDAVLFSIKNPSIDAYHLDIEYQVKNHVDQVVVNKAVPFPLSALDNDLAPFVTPTETIDTNQQIRNLAASLAAGQDDLFKVVANIASWTKENIAYNLSTISVEASQPASWVLENRQGVCDEMTNLFIAMLRSLGVPARFVSGLAYTNSPLFSEPWGAHGWAEVYFPGVGWVPFDVTYNQLGWVDASHIVLATGVDSGTSGSSYAWLGRDVHVDVQGMTFSTTITDESGTIDPLLTANISALEPEVSLDSYQLVILTVRNPTARYVADTFQLASVDGFTFLDDNKFQDVVLAPGEETKLFWRVKLDHLQRGYAYTFPLIAVSQRGARAESSFAASPHGRSLSSSLLDRFVSAADSAALPYDEDMTFSCATDQEHPRVGEAIAVSCTLQNSGELDMRAVSVCLGDDCQQVSVPAGQHVTADFSISFNVSSLHGVTAVASSDAFEKRAFLSVDVVSPASVEIVNLSAPASLAFDASGTISFAIVPNGSMRPTQVQVSVVGPRSTHTWPLDALAARQSFTVQLAGKSLSLRDDRFQIVVSYVDDRGQTNTVHRDISIVPQNLSWWQKAYLWLMDLL